jgi:hypothetical protein
MGIEPASVILSRTASKFYVYVHNRLTLSLHPEVPR